MNYVKLNGFLLVALIALFATNAGAGLWTIVIDPGHSPKRPGAKSCTGKPEYLYNWALADVIATQLKGKNIRTTFSHRPDQEMTLQARAASAVGKGLFLSVHHDSVQPQFLSYSEGKPFSKKAEGYSVFVSKRNPHFQQSLQYARILGRELRKRGMKPSYHHAERIRGEGREVLDVDLGIFEFSDLIVLKEANAPALLLEAAVIVNPVDDSRASSFEYQEAIAEAITTMVVEGGKIGL